MIARFVFDENVFALAWSHLWQVTLLVLFAMALSRTWLRQRPKMCHVVWTLVLVKSLFPPIVASPLGIFSWCQVHVSEQEVLGAMNHSALDVSPVTSAIRSLLILLAAVWLLGAVAKSLVVWARWSSVRTAMTRHREETPDDVLSAVQRIAERLDIGPVSVCVTSANIGPAVFGLFKKCLVLPVAVLEGQTAEQLEPILSHELIHLRRGDTVASSLHAVVDIVWWFNPVVRWGTREASLHCERSADADVLRLMNYAPSDYANCLLSVLEMKCRPIVGSAGMNAFQITEQRLQHIMKGAHARRTGRAHWLAATMLAFAILPGARLAIDPAWIVPVHEFKPDLPPGFKCWSAMEDSEVALSTELQSEAAKSESAE